MNFRAMALAGPGYAVGQIIALPPKFAYLPVDNKVFYQCKRGFFVGYV